MSAATETAVAATWGTTKAHGKPAELMFHGQLRDQSFTPGVRVRVTLLDGRWFLINAETGLYVASGGHAWRYWASPVPTETTEGTP